MLIYYTYFKYNIFGLKSFFLFFFVSKVFAFPKYLLAGHRLYLKKNIFTPKLRTHKILSVPQKVNFRVIFRSYHLVTTFRSFSNAKSVRAFVIDAWKTKVIFCQQVYPVEPSFQLLHWSTTPVQAMPGSLDHLLMMDVCSRE